MDKLRTTFFEDPTYVYVSLAVAMLVLAAVWYERPTRRRLMLLAAPPLLAVAVFAVEAAVVTDREQIVAAAEDVAACFQAGDVRAALKHLDEDFTADLGRGTLTKADVRAVAEPQIATYGVQRIRLTKMDVSVAQQRADMHAVTMITFRSGRTPLVWDVRWIKRAGGWRILRVAEPEVRMEF